MCRINKIKAVTILEIIMSFILIVTSLFVAIIPSFYLNNILSIILFFIIFILLSIVLIYILDLIFANILSKFKAKNKIIAIECDIKISNSYKKLNCIDGLNIYYDDNHNLKTITCINLKTTDINECKALRKKSKNIIKSSFKVAKETSPKKKHWKYEIYLYSFQKVDILKSKEVILKLNNDNLYEIGKFNIGYLNNILIIRNYDCYGKVDVSSLFNYLNCIKQVCNLCSLNYKEIINYL